MNEKSEDLQLKTMGLDFNGKDFFETELTYKLNPDNSAAGYGRLISARACRAMIERKFSNQMSDIERHGKEPFAHECGREGILRILGQEGCEGIRFIRCIPARLCAAGVGR